MSFWKKKDKSSFDTDIDTKDFKKYHKYSKIEVPEFIYVKNSNQTFAFDMNSKNIDEFNRYNISALMFGMLFIIVNIFLLFTHILSIIPLISGDIVYLDSDLNLNVYEFLTINIGLSLINIVTLVTLAFFNILIFTRTQNNKRRAMTVYAVGGIVTFILRLGLHLLVPYNISLLIIISLVNIVLTIGGIIFIKIFIIKPQFFDI